MRSFIEYPEEHPFSIHNLPYGSFYTGSDASQQRCGVAIGDKILDLRALSQTTFFPADVPFDIFSNGNWNAFMALGRPEWTSFRRHLQSLLSTGSELEKSEHRANVFVDRLASDTHMCIPARIGDYTDFYASLEHAYNCGVLIRGEANAMQPNWHHLPVAYHGRASSIVVSGTPFHRPIGQILPEPGAKQPVLSASKKLDYELEVGFFYGGAATKLGERLSPAQAADHVFGAVILADWSARDIQTWEYVPLGPFLSKNFATTISPWIVSIDALDSFTCAGYTRDPPLLPYLDDANNTNFDIPLRVEVKGANDTHYTVTGTSSLKHTYYTVRQMIAHHSTSGCPLLPGDLIGTGTLSAPGEQGYGSLLEKSQNGKRPFAIGKDGEQMIFLRDGDSVRMSGSATSSAGICIGFGDCEATILPALPL